MARLTSTMAAIPIRSITERSLGPKTSLPSASKIVRTNVRLTLEALDMLLALICTQQLNTIVSVSLVFLICVFAFALTTIRLLWKYNELIKHRVD